MPPTRSYRWATSPCSPTPRRCLSGRCSRTSRPRPKGWFVDHSDLAEGKELTLDPKTATNDELAAFFAEVLPDYDRDRVYMTHVRKLIQWYNLLLRDGVTEFKPLDDETVEKANDEEQK